MRLTEDPLFLACTRPAMVGGVTIEAMGANVVLTAMVFLAGGSLLYFSVGLLLHLLFRAICKVDHNQFRVLAAWLNSKGRARTKDYFGAATYTPLVIRKSKKARG
ncbi:type IV secretion system protein VirB3 [Pseudorhizobium xiangyangii]|uniref:type IV secretion system protein VirB3 n=1 Tax=Pseudorhizobium xiangyangii TaxID=2883104 RepID=UPI0036F3C8A4